MENKVLYPKTERVKCDGNTIVITEKLDGANLCFFNYLNEVYIAQRNRIFTLTELKNNIKEIKGMLYGGLYEWIINNEESLLNINDNSVICGEWLGMGGNIKYTKEDGFNKYFYMYAKANIMIDDNKFKLYNIKYDHDLFIYPFKDKIIPNCVGLVPIAYVKHNFAPNKENLDELYEEYTNRVGRTVEGFVLNDNDRISKYVRCKKGKLTPHHD